MQKTTRSSRIWQYGWWLVSIWLVIQLLVVACQTDVPTETPPQEQPQERLQDQLQDAAEPPSSDAGEAKPESAKVPEDPWSERDDPLPTPTPSTKCDKDALDTPQAIPPCIRGSGIFGFWYIDDNGLPAYEYTLDHLEDKRAVYPHSSDENRRDHSHQLGNDRVNGLAYNDGVVVLMGQDRGATLYNKLNEDQQNYAGGFSIIAEGDQVFNTAYRWRPPTSQTRRVFGMGYVQYITQYRGLRITHTIFAPPGDAPLLIDEVTVQNLTDTERNIRHYAYWDLNRHQLAFQPIRSGTWGPRGDDSRDQLNDPFSQQLTFDKDILRAEFTYKGDEPRPARDAVEKTDFYPVPVFLASLLTPPTEVYTDQKAFIGKGTIQSPEAAKTGRKGEVMPSHNALLQPATMIMRHDLKLPANGQTQLRFAFGYLPQGKELTLLAPYKGESSAPLADLNKHWKAKVAYTAAPDAPSLSREVPWHAYNLLAATNFLEYYQTNVTPQGSAYLYLHGFDGAPRDQALFSLTLSYLRPDLARANLRLIMGLTNSSDGRISYSFHGNGVRENAVIHTAPSDLDIFFFMAMGEYLAATGDTAFLQEQVSFHPKGSNPAPGAKGNTVLDHLRAAYTHLVNEVGLGPNGLIRVGTGDWSDGIVRENDKKYNPEYSIASGESIPNSQMAIYALRQLAPHLETADAALAQNMRDYADKLVEPTRKQFTGQWFIRAWLRDNDDKPATIGEDSINLEAQPWGLLSGILDADQTKTLVQNIYDQLDKPSPIGPTLTPKGMVWPAIAQLMTWAYVPTRPELAWATLQRQMFVTHAETWPEIWFGIWSGPDGFHSDSGKTCTSVVTPMTDWPVMNVNQDAMFLLGLLRTAGVSPYAKGLQIAAPATPSQLHIDFPLLRLKRNDKAIEGEYRPHNNGTLSLTLRPPSGTQLTEIKLQGKSVPLPQDKSSITLELTLQKGTPIPFSYQWQ